MSLKKTLFLALLLLAGAIWAWYGEFRPAEQKKVREEADKKLFDFRPETADGLKITALDKTVELEKKDGAWKITAPVRAAGDEAQIAGFINAIAAGEATGFLDGNDGDYGLSPAVMTIEISHGGKRDVLYVGATSPTGTVTYVKSSKANRAATADSRFGRAVSKNLYQLRNKRFVKFDPSAIDRFELAFPGGKTAALAKKETGWNFTAPADWAADQETPGELLSKLGNAAATEFADGKTEAETGLATPRLSVTLHEKDRAETLIFGGETKDRLGVYAKRAAGPEIMVLPGALMNGLPKTAEELRDRRIFSFVPGAIIKMALARGKEKAEFALLSGVWEYSDNGKTSRADDARLQSLMDSLAALRAAEFADGPAVARLKKIAPYLTVSLTADKSEVSASFYKDAGKVFVVRGRMAARLDENAFKPLDTAPSTLADRHVFRVRQHDVAMVSVERDKFHIGLVKKDGQWRIAGTKKFADLFKVGNLVSGLCGLTYVQSLNGGAGEIKPLAAITLSGEPGSPKTRASVLQHSSDKTLLLVKPEGENMLYVVKADELLRFLPQKMEDLL